MKTLLSSLFGIALSGVLFSQNCIEKHIGIYKVDLDRTIEQIRENDPSKANEEPPKKFLEMAKKASLVLTENKMYIINLGPQNPFDFVAKTSDKKGGSCDLVLNIPEETKLPEGVEIPTFTVYEKEDGRIHIQEGSKMSRINDFIWRKIE